MNRAAVKILSITMMILLVTGCGRKNLSNITELNYSEPIGSPFNVALVREYNKLSLLFQSDYLARKGLAANDGIFVMPEALENFRWANSNRDIIEKTEARARLMNALTHSARQIAPYEVAVAQTRYDCWVLGYEYREGLTEMRLKKEQRASKPFSCRGQFIDLMNLVEKKVNGRGNLTPEGGKGEGNDWLETPEIPEPYMFPSIESIARGRRKGDLAAIDEAMFLVFFDWDKSNVSKSANKILDAVADEIKSRKDIKHIRLIGHADTSGDEKYNQNLSVNRAINVSYALIDRGIVHSMISAEGHGERDLLVPTPDNTREPSNRRVAISFE